jgi:hypothetical protein
MSSKSPHHSKYKSSPRFIIVNDQDPELEPVKVTIPVCPDLKEIEGYGLKPEDQKFVKPEIPQRLLDIESELNDIEEIESYLSKHQLEYADEVAFIEREWDRRENGHWFFNNGVPTFITGTHYLYISYWEIDIGVPDYRDRDRRFFIFLRFCEDDSDSMGLVYPKHRREGATHKTQCWIYDGVSTKKRSLGGIQSATETHAKDVFQLHLVPGWKSLPFFFKPKFEGTTNPKSELSFNEPPTKITKGKMSSKKGDYLASKINFRSSDIKAYDSRKLYRYHGDEVGKTTEIDVNKRHGIVKECLVNNHKIVGKACLTSTVEEMDKGGGANFKKICDQSHYAHKESKYSRDKNGRTVSGLYLLFIPAHDGFLVDEYGNSLIKESLELIKNTRQGFIDKDDAEGLSSYIRKYPTSYKECWRGDASDCKFDIHILEAIMDKYRFGNDDLVRGNFQWINGFGGKVTFVPSDRGKWNVSYLFDRPEEANRIYKNNNETFPGNTDKFIVGSDPFKFKKTTGSNSSEGGIAVWMRRDLSIDGDDIDISDWESNRFVATYRNRTKTKNEYCEDVLMACMYYGCQVNTEINVDMVWDFMDDNGFGRFLWYEIDQRTGKFKPKPGTYTGEATKEEIYRAYQMHIALHGLRSRHDDLMLECYEIGDDMGPFDLFAAGGMCLREDVKHIRKISFAKNIEANIDLKDYFSSY